MISHNSDAINNQSTIKIQKIVQPMKISNAQMHELAVNDYKFEQKIRELNKKGVEAIEKEDQTNGLLYLQQAERILEFVASCGRTIDRVFITTTLKNEACAYQRLWDLEKASDYMEAILYNMKTSLDAVSMIQFDSAVKDQTSKVYLQVSTFLGRKIQSIFYYLQYAAINSQINRHALALQSTKKALSLIHSVCTDCLKYQKIKKGKNSWLMAQLVNSCILQTIHLNDLIIQTKQALDSVQKHRQFFNFDTEVIENFVIGDVMQINTVTIENASIKSELEKEISQLGIINKALYLSICYFVMGTEIRLLSQQKQLIDQKASKEEFRLSKLYHLFSIKIVSTLVSCQSKYLGHIVNSFKTHYSIDLYRDEKISHAQISTIEIEGKQSYEEIQVRAIQEKMQTENQKYHLNNKTNTIFLEPTSCDIQTSEDLLCSPKGKIKNHKKSVPKTAKVGNKYTFPKIKHLGTRVQFNTSKSREAKKGELKNSRVKKISQEYFLHEQKKKVLKSRKKGKNHNVRSKSKETSLESRGGVGIRNSREKNIYLKPNKREKK